MSNDDADVDLAEGSPGGAHGGSDDIKSLREQLAEFEEENAVLSMENQMLEAFYEGVAHEIGEEMRRQAELHSNDGVAGKKKLGKKDKKDEGLGTLTIEQKQRCAQMVFESNSKLLDHSRADREREIDESKVAIDMHDENFVSLRRLMFELQRSLKSAAINNNVLLKHFEGSIQNKESLIDKLSMKCIVGDKKRETLQAQLSSGTNDGEVFGTIDFDQLQIENSQLQSQLQEKIDSRNSELLALKQATAMTLTRLNAFKLQLSEVLTETTWLKGQKQQKMLAIDKVKGELDNVNSHVGAEDALKRRLARELKLGSAVPPVLDYVTNVMKLEKLRLKEKNESKRVQVKEAQLKATKMALSRAVAAADVPAYMARQELSRRGL